MYAHPTESTDGFFLARENVKFVLGVQEHVLYIALDGAIQAVSCHN